MSSEPAAAGRSRWRRRLLLAVGGVALFALGGLVATAAALYLHADASVERIEVDTLTDPGDLDGDGVADYEELGDAVNVLVVGMDGRDGLTEEERRELGTGDAEGERTDAVMLARLDPDADEVALLSFPRDLRVERCDGSVGKINAAYQIGETTGRGGPSCLVETIRDVSGISIQHFVSVDFAGFIELVDVVDGVDVYLEHPIDDWRANLHLDAGCHRLDGVEALGFVRHRASDSDYGRIARQQRLIKELVRESVQVGNLVNVPRLFQMVEAGASAVEADDDLSLERMRRIAFSLRDISDDGVVAQTVPADFEMIDDIAYEIPREEQARELFTAFRTGQMGDPRDDADEEDAPRLSAEDVPAVRVLNGAGITNLASEMSAELAEKGFAIAEVGDAETTGREGTKVRYPPHLAAEAEFLAAHVPGADLEAVDGATAIEIVLGETADPDAVAAPVRDEGPLDEGREPGEPPPEPDEFYVGAQPVPDYCRR